VRSHVSKARHGAPTLRSFCSGMKVQGFAAPPTGREVFFWAAFPGLPLRFPQGSPGATLLSPLRGVASVPALWSPTLRQTTPATKTCRRGPRGSPKDGAPDHFGRVRRGRHARGHGLPAHSTVRMWNGWGTFGSLTVKGEPAADNPGAIQSWVNREMPGWGPLRL
jgi:hypothetical protein